MGARIVLSSAPPGEAHALARRLVDEGLAACVSLVPGVRSLFRWKGSTSDEPETLLVVKVGGAHLEALMARLTELHPYEVPELLVIEPAVVGAAYLAWLEEGDPGSGGPRAGGPGA
jgi:periplasmic divalent cation tolerance protein